MAPLVVAIPALWILVALVAARTAPTLTPRRPAASSGVARVAATSAPILRIVPVVLAVGVVAALFGPVPAMLAGTGGAVSGRLRLHARARRRQQAIDRALPDLIDLLRLAAGAGLPVVASLVAVAPRGPPALAGVLATSVAQLDRGLALGDVLSELDHHLGSDAAPLVAALERAAATGAPLGPLLVPVGTDAHERRRRHAQEAAHRLPVSLLLPLAGCSLPAAIVLAIVPVVAVALGDVVA